MAEPARAPEPIAIPGAQSPFNLDAERAVLGAILLDNGVIPEVMQVLRGEDFYQAAHHTLYRRMIEVYDQGKPVDLTILADTLRRTGELDSVGGYLYIANLENYVMATSAAPEHARLVKEKSTLRRLMSAAGTILREAAEEQQSVEDTIELAEKLVFEVSQENRVSRFQSLQALMPATISEISFLYENKTPVAGLPTHFTELDKLMGGFESSALIILAARPSIGKTAFALNLVRNVAVKTKVPVAFFSLEMGADQLNMRLLCAETGIPSHRVRRGLLKEDEWDKMRSIASDMMDYPIFIDDSASLSIVQLRSRARRLKSQQPNLGLIVVDYLQLMSGGPTRGRDANRQQEVSEISRGLKQLAKELNTPVLALSQLSRNIENRSGKTKSARPMLSDLRESGAIEQDADVVMFVHRERVEVEKDEDGKPRDRTQPIPTEIIVGKNRNGPIGTAELLFIPDSIKFVNQPRQ